ncbi:MAG TPA: hypothetical protein VFX44_08540 [Solirubrobacterales bacterium]|nr:hypothetical protein [Solirubrobacterales bacterium]
MKAAELREHLAEAPAELATFAERIAATNGSGPDEDLRQDALDYAGEVVADADRLDQIERRADPERHRVRQQAEELIASLEGGERSHEEAWDAFRAEHGEMPMDFLRRQLRSPDLRRVIKHGRSNSLWDLELQNGDRVPLGNSEQIQEPKKVRGALLSVGRPIKRFSLKEFDPVTEALALVAEVEDTIASEDEETAAWVASFVGHWGGGQARRLEGDHLVHLLESPDDIPVFRDGEGRIYLRLARLAQHVTKHIGQRTTVRDLSARLDRAGFASRQLSARSGERVLKARYWHSPAGYDAEGAA